jgi:curli production assembly/transport component CsgE
MNMRSGIIAGAMLIVIGAADAQPGQAVLPMPPDPAAQVAEPSATIGAQPRMQQELYGGIVINQTVTVAGQDFYQYFVASWRDKPNSERYSVSVHERPSARWGTQVWVEYQRKPVFRALLPTMRASVPSISARAVEISYQKIMDADVQRLLYRDQDLGPDEI